MKREEVRAVFPEATEEEVDAILNKVRDELNPLKRQLKDAESERDSAQAALSESQANEAGYRKQLDEANAKLEEGLSDEERMAAREKAAEEREREFTLKSNGLDAREIFVSAGYFDAEEVAELVGQVTTGDAEQTKAAAQRIVDTVAKQREAVEKATRDAMLKANPKLQGNAGGDDVVPTTVKEFLELPYERQLELKEADPNIISNLTS